MYNLAFVYKSNLIRVQGNSNNIHIFDSYKIKRKQDMKKILSIIQCASFNRGIFYTRKQSSWLREWKAHNILYKMGIKRTSSKDTDLYEKESKKRRFIYFILSLFYWK